MITRRIALLLVLALLIGFRAAAQETPTPETSAYVVRSGDTLGQIAARYHTTVGEIMRLNHLTSAELIVIGQTLVIPAAVGTAAPDSIISPDVPVTTPTQATPAFDYGIEALFDNQDVSGVVQSITALGMRWGKARVSWRTMEQTRGSVDYAPLDAVIDGLQASGLSILLTVTDAPDWARSTALENGPPDDFDQYARFIGALAQRYAGRVRAYEIWNEPNLRREWHSEVHPIDADGYADLLRRAYAAVKAADPSTLVVSAGLAPTGFNDGVNAIDDRQFLARLYQLGLADISDAIGAHPFGFANPPDSVCCAAPAGVLTHYGHPSFYFLDTLNDYHRIMLESGDSGAQIWVTRFGWGTSEDTDPPPRNSVYVRYITLADQAEYVTRGFELGASLGFVGVMILYDLNGCAVQPLAAEACYYSLLAPSGQPRPAYEALSMVFAAAGER